MNKGQRDRIIKIQELMAEQSFSELSKSQYSLKDVLNLNQFRSLSQQIKLHQAQQQRLVDQFYYPTYKSVKYKLERYQPPVSPYQQEYNRWKGSQQKVDNSFKSTYQSTLALLNKQKQKDQVKRLIKEGSLDNALFQYSPNNAVLSSINHQYSQSIHKLITKVETRPNYQVQTNTSNQISQKNYSQMARTLQKQREMEKQLNKQRMIEIQVQKQLLQRIKRVDQQQRKQQAKRRKELQLKKTCFIDLIQRPPNFINPSKSTISSKSKLQQIQVIEVQTGEKPTYRQTPTKQRRRGHYRLNIAQILKIPHRLFLIFYSQNYNQIVRMASPQDLKAINSYRDQALARQGAVEKLQKKVAQEGSELISKLPSQMKEKLFKILYQKDLQQQAYWQRQ